MLFHRAVPLLQNFPGRQFTSSHGPKEAPFCFTIGERHMKLLSLHSSKECLWEVLHSITAMGFPRKVPTELIPVAKRQREKKQTC